MVRSPGSTGPSLCPHGQVHLDGWKLVCVVAALTPNLRKLSSKSAREPPGSQGCRERERDATGWGTTREPGPSGAPGRRRPAALQFRPGCDQHTLVPGRLAGGTRGFNVRANRREAMSPSSGGMVTSIPHALGQVCSVPPTVGREDGR